MDTNAEIQHNGFFCSNCNSELDRCTDCKYPFDSEGDNILCNDEEHFCQDCAEELK